MADLILETRGLKKTFVTKDKKTVEAVKGVDLEVRAGKIFGFLGPNGAGKTTTLQMLTTLLKPSGGEATVDGYDLLKHPQKIREHIGYVSQLGGSDSTTTAIDNLILQGRLYDLDPVAARKRANELIEQFQISEFAHRYVSSYSGGQKRRLDLALGLVHHPKIIFLDEPTTGLDPQSRAHFWGEIRKIKKDGTTIFLTTHYLEEADNLCDYIAIVDHGKIVAEGSPDHLKQAAGGDSIIIGMENDRTLEQAKNLMRAQEYVLKTYSRENKLYLYVKEGEKLLAEVLRFLDKNEIELQTIELAKPSLDDVFLQHTGRSLREGGES